MTPGACRSPPRDGDDVVLAREHGHERLPDRAGSPEDDDSHPVLLPDQAPEVAAADARVQASLHVPIERSRPGRAARPRSRRGKAVDRRAQLHVGPDRLREADRAGRSAGKQPADDRKAAERTGLVDHRLRAGRSGEASSCRADASRDRASRCACPHEAVRRGLDLLPVARAERESPCFRELDQRTRRAYALLELHGAGGRDAARWSSSR